MFNILNQIAQVFLPILLNRWRILVGRDPRRVPPGSVIFFPLQTDFLPCGLAGIVAFKSHQTLEKDPIAELISALSELKQQDVSPASGSLSSDQFIREEPTIERMEGALLSLRDGDPFANLFFDTEKATVLSSFCSDLSAFIMAIDTALEQSASILSTYHLEQINSRLIRLKDVLWGLEKDILENIPKILELCGCHDVSELSRTSLNKYRKINLLLNCIDRLEVRGRDSAGIQISLTFDTSHEFETAVHDLKSYNLEEEFAKRCRIGDLMNGSIHLSLCDKIDHGLASRATLSFTYKTASVIGDLGQNVRDLRQIISTDLIFRAFAERAAALETSFAHTRWASVGSITEENCHPVSNYILGKSLSLPQPCALPPHFTDEQFQIKDYPAYGKGNWLISVILNGDIDNYASLRDALETERDLIAPEITTDTKIIPLQMERYLMEGHDLAESFRLAVKDFEGSHAIAMVSNLDPGKAYLAIRGSGQAIYVGLASDSYVYSSEVYGLVECTAHFLKMDGEIPSGPDRENETGQIFTLDGEIGGLSGVRACFYDGTPFILDDRKIQTAEITTRDIDRGSYPHFFLKEISESSVSVRKTLRGKYWVQAGKDGHRKVIFNLGPDILPDHIRQALLHRDIRSITLVGQGTAAVAAYAVADGLERYLRGTGINVQAQIASELSGFCLHDSLKDMLVIPITQSGTTTDTNRAVIMAMERGASVIAIVNRRQSDITTRSHGVLYTSDGRDIEMSVASTKAFYCQIIAGHILALCIAQLLAALSDDEIATELINLERTPEMMARVIQKKEEIQASVEQLAKHKSYWAVVGSGPNKVAADEIRIKLSELCYKTISSDVVENKKHIDLSAEPLILVCAAGNPEAVMGDIVKDIAIFKAHKAGVVAFTDEGETRLGATADTVIEIPRMPQPLPVILNTLGGHLWGYYAACSINDDAVFLRTFRSLLSQAIAEQRKAHIPYYDRMADRRFRQLIRDFTAQFHARRKHGGFAFAGGKTVSDMLLLLKYAVGKLPLEDFWADFPDESEMASPTDLLDITLGHAIDELSRPIDAIRHQAKTVTVGTSRKEAQPQGVLFDLLRELAFPLKAVFSRNIQVMNRIQSAIADIRGYTLYDILNLEANGSVTESATVTIHQRGGVSLQMASRIQGVKPLMGTKRTIARTGAIYAGLGKSDSTQIVIIPLLGDQGEIRHLLLVHVTFKDSMSVAGKREILEVKYNDIRNLINEYNLLWEDTYLESMSPAYLLGEPAEVIAGQIRQNLERN